MTVIGGVCIWCSVASGLALVAVAVIGLALS